MTLQNCFLPLQLFFLLMFQQLLKILSIIEMFLFHIKIPSFNLVIQLDMQLNFLIQFKCIILLFHLFFIFILMVILITELHLVQFKFSLFVYFFIMILIFLLHYVLHHIIVEQILQNKLCLLLI